MNLQSINPPLKEGERILCAGCFRWIYHDQQPVADRDGEPFRAYYCRACRPDNFIPRAQKIAP